MKRSFLLVVPLALAAVLVLPGRARAQSSDADDVARLRGELMALRKEVKELKAQVAHLVEQMGSIAPVASDVTKPALDPALGFVVPGLPKTSFGAESASELARFLHHYATSGEHDLESLLAFNRIDFFVPESLWSPAAAGLKTVQGVPTRDELELALAALGSQGAGSRLVGIRPVPDLAPKNGESCIQVWDLDAGVDNQTERFRLTAVKLGGRWCAAHLLDVSAEEDARGFLEDVVTSQRSYYRFKQGRYAHNLHELAGAREIETNPSIKAAGLTFPLGARLDRKDKDRLERDGNDFRNRFYRFSLTGDDKAGWTAVARPVSPSYWSFSVTVPASADPSLKVDVKRFRGSGPADASPDSRTGPGRREGEQEGE